MSRKERVNESFSEKNYVVSIGFFGGLFSAILAYIAHFFKFISFGPGAILRFLPTYHTVAWLRGPSGHLLAIGLIAVFSILIAMLYYILFRRMNTTWVGLWYGLTLWVIIFIGINQMLPNVRSAWKLGMNTNITLICIFLFYGLFIGYSISYQHQQLLEGQNRTE